MRSLVPVCGRALAALISIDALAWRSGSRRRRLASARRRAIEHSAAQGCATLCRCQRQNIARNPQKKASCEAPVSGALR